MIKQQFEKVVHEVKSGEKYTLFGFNEFGFPFSQHVVIDKAYIGKYAQYDNALYIVYKPKRKRTWYKKVITPNNTMVIWEGWHNVQDNMYKESEEINGVVIQMSLNCFDKTYLHDALKSVSVEPLAVIDQDYHKNIQETEYVYQIVNGYEIKYYNSIEEIKQDFEVIGIETRYNLRKELHHQPKIKSLTGPMYNGMKEGKHVIRYEGKEQVQQQSKSEFKDKRDVIVILETENGEMIKYETNTFNEEIAKIWASEHYPNCRILGVERKIYR
jgi:hypothetical protein